MGFADLGRSPVIDTTTGVKYPAAYWLAAPNGTDCSGLPAELRAEYERDYMGWVASEQARFADWAGGVGNEWNRNGELSAHAARSGFAGAWFGGRHIVQSLVSDELGKYWTEVSPRLSQSEYVAWRWATDGQFEREAEAASMQRWLDELRERRSDCVDGTFAICETYGVAEWSAGLNCWLAVADSIAEWERPVARDIRHAVAVLRESGLFTETMLGRFESVYAEGKFGRKKRVIAAAGDFEAAAVCAFGDLREGTKRAAAVAAAREVLQVRVIDMSVPF